jgi:phage terminase large subunit
MQTYCRNCKFNERGNCIPSRREWLNAEYYKEPISVVDWSKVSKDTPVMVCFTNPECEDNWFPRYWYKFVDDSTRPFMTYSDGTTSFTHKEVVSWRYAKLVRQEDIEKYSVEENT